MEANSAINQVVVESEAAIQKVVKRRRTKKQMITLKNSKRSIAHRQRWLTLSDEKKQIVLKNLEMGRRIRGEMYANKIRNEI